jgi:hypothetical protein
MGRFPEYHASEGRYFPQSPIADSTWARHGPVLRGLRHSISLTRDQKIEIRTLRNHLEWDYFTIARATGKTFRQVQDVLTGPLTA